MRPSWEGRTRQLVPSVHRRAWSAWDLHQPKLLPCHLAACSKQPVCRYLPRGALVRRNRLRRDTQGAPWAYAAWSPSFAARQKPEIAGPVNGTPPPACIPASPRTFHTRLRSRLPTGRPQPLAEPVPSPWVHCQPMPGQRAPSSKGTLPGISHMGHGPRQSSMTSRPRIALNGPPSSGTGHHPPCRCPLRLKTGPNGAILRI